MPRTKEGAASSKTPRIYNRAKKKESDNLEGERLRDQKFDKIPMFEIQMTHISTLMQVLATTHTSSVQSVPPAVTPIVTAHVAEQISASLRSAGARCDVGGRAEVTG